MRLLNRATGKTRPVRCDKWNCGYCGRIHAFKWCKRIEFAKPKRFLTLTRVGDTLTEACKNLTYFSQVIRREGYPFQYFAVPELSEQNKLLHFHMLTHGRDWGTNKENGYIPQAFIGEAAKRARMGYIADIRWLRGVKRVDLYAMKNVFGYATKKLTGGDLWTANPRRRRVRYSQEFFPMSAAEIDEQLQELRDAGAGDWILQIQVGDNWIRPRDKRVLQVAKAASRTTGEYNNIFERPEQTKQDGEGFDSSVDLVGWNEYQKSLSEHVYNFARRAYFEEDR